MGVLIKARGILTHKYLGKAKCTSTRSASSQVQGRTEVSKGTQKEEGEVDDGEAELIGMQYCAKRHVPNLTMER